LPTDDLRDHLKLDRRNSNILVYHHVGFLKEQLQLTKHVAKDASIEDSLRLGALPRQFVLEVLDSLQAVLFPLTDKKSRRLLNSYTSSGMFDPDMEKFEFGAIRNIGEEHGTIPFLYLADRLSELYAMVQNPPPQGWLESRLERWSGNRYMMLATLIGVVFAVFLGMLSLVVSSYQTYIAYQAWKHPVSPDLVT